MSNRPFFQLRYPHVCALLEVLQSVQLRKISHVRRLFSERAQGFDEVLSFLVDLDILTIEEESIRVNAQHVSADPPSLRTLILDRLTIAQSKYRAELYRFLTQFKVVNDDVTYTPIEQNRSRDSAIRNFLVELGVVLYDRGNEQCLLAPEHASLFAIARSAANQTSTRQLETTLRDRKSIGFAAEREILQFERRRVGEQHANSVDHVSMRNVSAGYDILSVSLDSFRIAPRFVEVKAVPKGTYQFFWSKNEVRVAKQLSSLYYLYLLPVNRYGQFDLASLSIVGNPIESVFGEQSAWVTEGDAVVCYKRTSLCN